MTKLDCIDETVDLLSVACQAHHSGTVHNLINTLRRQLSELRTGPAPQAHEARRKAAELKRTQEIFTVRSVHTNKACIFQGRDPLFEFIGCSYAYWSQRINKSGLIKKIDKEKKIKVSRCNSQEYIEIKQTFTDIDLMMNWFYKKAF